MTQRLRDLPLSTRMLLVVIALQLTGIACVTDAAFAAAEPFGRVFLTPQQRAALDLARRQKVKEIPKPVAHKPAPVVVAAPKPERPSGNVTLNGIVRRSDGESTIWVNGVAMPGDAQTGKVQVAPNTSQSGIVQIPNAESNGRVEIKVGQKLELSSGAVTERYTNRTPPPRSSAGNRATGSTERGTLPRSPRRYRSPDPEAPENQ